MFRIVHGCVVLQQHASCEAYWGPAPPPIIQISPWFSSSDPSKLFGGDCRSRWWWLQGWFILQTTCEIWRGCWRRKFRCRYTNISTRIHAYLKQSLGSPFQGHPVWPSPDSSWRSDRALWQSDRRRLCVARSRAGRLGSLLREGPHQRNSPKDCSRSSRPPRTSQVTVGMKREQNWSLEERIRATEMKTEKYW
jgi:hypothetical protein